MWDPRASKPPSGRQVGKPGPPSKASLPPRFQQQQQQQQRVGRESGEEGGAGPGRVETDPGRDTLGELPPTRLPSQQNSWTDNRRRLDSSDSAQSKDVSGVSDWSLEVEEEDERNR